MLLVPTRQALQLTGLSAPTLREWTSRRALIPADVPPKSQGSAAQFSWQTILLLRIANTLSKQFHLELQAHRSLFTSLRRGLRGRSFTTLWDKAFVLHGRDEWTLVDAGVEPLKQDGILILLNPHLGILSEEFVLPKPAGVAGQLDLFPRTPVGECVKSTRSVFRQAIEQRRRSA